MDLSSDNEATVDSPLALTLSSSQLTLERLIVKVFNKYRCDVIITDRLRTLFDRKLRRMGRRLQSLGGTGRAKLIDTWKETGWTVDLKPDEIVTRKRKADHLVTRNREKVAKVDELNKKLNDLTNQVSSLENTNKELASALKNSARSGTLKQTRQKKPWSKCSKQYQRRVRKQLAKNAENALSFAENEHFTPRHIELENKETGEIMSVHKGGHTITKPKPANQEENRLDKTLYIKEKLNISNQTYHELAMVNPDLPRGSMLTKRQKELNRESVIRPVPGKVNGVEQSLTERLKKRISHLANTNPSAIKDGRVRVKITGDGTRISNSMHSVVIAFVVIEEQLNSPSGNHTIALLNTREKYDELLESLENIRDEIKQIRTIRVDNVEYDIEFFLSADWKFLAILVGIESASANYSCIWCICHKDERHETSKVWSIQDTSKGARTIEDIKKLAKEKKRGSEKFGCIRQPMFPSIPIDHVIPDILHLFLRICDLLINLFIMELRRLDGIEKLTLKKFDRSAATEVVRYENFLNTECKISFHMYLDKDSKSLKWRDLVGPEKLKLFKQIDIMKLFPRIPNAQSVHLLWKSFLSIYETLRSNTPLSKEEISEFRRQTQRWITRFLSIYQSKHITPYVHLLVSHIPEFLELYGTLSPYSQQGLEKLNDDLTKDYFRSTNHRENDALKQMLLKLNRLEELGDQDCLRPKQTHVCRLCKQSGHNARTCTKVHTDNTQEETTQEQEPSLAPDE